ncbi:MAG: TraB/GumN family protein [Dehalococcoidales bacterium]|nr:TraB/GumN family protein [Dehalococcoidales bacterium]
MENNVTRLDYNGKNIILIATAHVSEQSAQLVKKVIEEEKPDSVCVELDEGRYKSILNPQSWENTNIAQVIKEKKVGFMLANLFLSAYQKKMARQLNTIVGREMLQGIESARETGAELVLADRQIQITFRRIWKKLGLWGKLKLFYGFLFSFVDDTKITEDDINEILEKDILESAISEVRNEFPAIGEVLISERDQYLAYKIKEAPGSKIVAVLGGAHVPGVKEEIYKTQDIEKITQVSKGSPVFKIIGWAIPVVIVGLIAYGFINNIQTGIQQLSLWFLWNSLFAGLFTTLALGHPLSILTSIVAAPFTSLNPMVACGWLTGLVEATVRKPTVYDVNNIPQDIFSFKGFFKNRFLRVFLIIVMTNLGSSLGTFVAGADIIKNLF